jgi:hypothetical protein
MVIFPDHGNKQVPIRSGCGETCAKNSALQISQVTAKEMGIAPGTHNNVRWQFAPIPAPAPAQPAPAPPAPAPAQPAPAPPAQPPAAPANPLSQKGDKVSVSTWAGAGTCNQPIDFSKEPAVAIVRSFYDPSDLINTVV